MADYSPLSVGDMQRITSQVLRLVGGEVLALTDSDANEPVPAGAIGVMLYCATDFYWQLDAAAVAGDGGGAYATKDTWFNFALHPDVSAIHAILATGTDNLLINFLYG